MWSLTYYKVIPTMGFLILFEILLIIFEANGSNLLAADKSEDLIADKMVSTQIIIHSIFNKCFM